jgi:hypothetical protein
MEKEGSWYEERYPKKNVNELEDKGNRRFSHEKFLSSLWELLP